MRVMSDTPEKIFYGDEVHFDSLEELNEVVNLGWEIIRSSNHANFSNDETGHLLEKNGERRIVFTPTSQTP